ncbi:alpha/beta hydrolase [Calditrichota bacterium]
MIVKKNYSNNPNRTYRTNGTITFSDSSMSHVSHRSYKSHITMIVTNNFLTFTLLSLLSTLLFIPGCMKLDGFLFNTEQLDSYSLPGNTIPDSLIEEVTLQSDGNTLYGYWVASNGNRPGLTLLYCHGNKHNLDAYWNRVMVMHELGVNLFIFDYRGFGKSEGESSEEGLYKDGETALDYVLGRAEVAEDSLVIYGYSLGNVVSIYLASEIIDPLCLFAESPFAAAASLAQGSTIIDIPHRWLTEGEYNNAERIKKIHTPFLLFHGEDDDFIRFRDNGKIVYKNAPEPKMLIVVPGADHNSVLHELGNEDYRQIILAWIEASIPY